MCCCWCTGDGLATKDEACWIDASAATVAAAAAAARAFAALVAAAAIVAPAAARAFDVHAAVAAAGGGGGGGAAAAAGTFAVHVPAAPAQSVGPGYPVGFAAPAASYYCHC